MAGFIGGGRGVNNAQTFVRLKPLKERKASAQEVANRIRMSLPQAGRRPDVPQPRSGHPVRRRRRQRPSTATPCSPTTSRRCGCGRARVRTALADLDELTGIEDELIASQQVTLNVDRTTARQLGVGMSDVTNTLNNAFGQRQVSTIYNALNQYRVVMEVAPELRPGAGGARSAPRRRRRPDASRWRRSARYQHTVARDRVNHFQQFASTSISFELKPGVSMSQATAAIERAVARLAMPSSIQGSMQGNSRLFQQAQGNQPLAILGTLLVVYIVLGVLYESYVHPLTILSTLPSAGVGALLALQLLNTEFSLVAMLGVFLLVGVVMKNAILMIDVALQLERENNLSPYDAIREACLLRLRPILMTTLAALLGALPLMLFQGEGAELRKPLGIAIVGGLFVSQVLTLYTTPVVYLYLDRMRLWAGGRRARRRAARLTPATES